MSAAERPKVTLGYPWRYTEHGLECRLRVPDYKYDSEGGYHALVRVTRDGDAWRVQVNSSRLAQTHHSLDKAIEAAEAALVENLERKLADARKHVDLWLGLFEQIGEKPDA